MIKAVIFDLFGVLISDNYWTYVKHDRHTDIEFRGYADDVNVGDISWQAFVAQVAEKTGTSEDDVNKMYESEQVDPQVAALINELHKTYKTALLTNAHHEFVEPLLVKNHLRGLFDEIIVSSRVGAVKPDPRIFEAALEKLGVQPGETVFIDDLVSHVAAADKMGIHSIRFINFDQAKGKLDKILA